MKSQDITAIITSFHSKEKIFNCLNSIGESIKVVVIENSNDQLLKKEISSKYNNVDCILSKENLGYGAGNNLGLSKVDTNYALIINPDVILKKDTLDKFFLAIKKVENFGIIAPLSKSEKYKNFNIDNDSSIKEVENVKGFAMFLNMKNLKKVNFFDENFFLYFEEIDLCKRLRNQNIKIYIDPSIEVSHLGGASHDIQINKPMELSRNWHWMWSTFYYHKKHFGYIQAFIRILPKLISSTLKFVIYMVIFNKFKSDIYKHRILGIINSVLLKKSWYRPKV
ncbi:glycosyltransferase family 2 protein [Candidatus Pelagibacter sp. HIMB1483]|uniref:glycosyltransferase family 2 protein n=1 Tax=Candidatus Pelagibacter sp. HIMB1483 TaxID=3415414 RepID=UPI003F84CD05